MKLRTCQECIKFTLLHVVGTDGTCTVNVVVVEHDVNKGKHLKVRKDLKGCKHLIYQYRG